MFVHSCINIIFDGLSRVHLINERMGMVVKKGWLLGHFLTQSTIFQ